MGRTTNINRARNSSLRRAPYSKRGRPFARPRTSDLWDGERGAYLVSMSPRSRSWRTQVWLVAASGLVLACQEDSLRLSPTDAGADAGAIPADAGGETIDGGMPRTLSVRVILGTPDVPGVGAQVMVVTGQADFVQSVGRDGWARFTLPESATTPTVHAWLDPA